ncbi:MAG: tRNA uridine-5-carboxymethylaminomethyl(34) synthesis GTPase MnmE [Oscillatoriales cyanobacterium SM2_1_8]|nr:tRNA uridine-5-carboxymethylaminomethyl(34) synthesis GTPase MnmE [Oscillatoriales cyanobacterium SM2_1_8]
MTDTIAAIATAVVPQQGSVAIVRMSGPDSLAIARQMFRVAGRQMWESHRVLYGWIVDPRGPELDEALVLWMQGPRSYTREDVVEFHCHGGIAVVQEVLRVCGALGARLAEPGEFTLRAFLNGRIDLTQAEGILDLVGARTDRAARMALAAVRGKLAQTLQSLRDRCSDVLAEIEARLDFAEDLPPLDPSAIAQAVAALQQEAEGLLATADRGACLRRGLKVAIVGQPNAGKSSLLNAWSRTDRAIVTPLPGTTRDVVDSHLTVGGLPVQVLDTAGLREADDEIERLGIARSRQALLTADLVLLVVDARQGWTPADAGILQEIGDRPVMVVLNKTDLADPEPIRETVPSAPNLQAVLPMVAAQGVGLEALEAAILHHVGLGRLPAADLEIAVNERQQAGLAQAVAALERSQGAIAAGLPPDFWSIDLRAAQKALGELTGEDAVESVLDRIFQRFCLGK